MALFVFLFYLSAGLVVSLAVVPIGQEGRRFFLFNAALALALGGIGLTLRLLAPSTADGGNALAPTWATATLGAVGLGLLAAYTLYGALVAERRRWLRAGAVLLSLAVLADGVGLHSTSTGPALPGVRYLHVLNALTSAWLAGSVLLAMVLGHFYLVMPRLSITPLRSLFRFSLIGLAARILIVAVVGTLWWVSAGRQAVTIGSFLGEGVFVLQRILFGLLIPASLAWFTYKTIEMRSTQSATGILYVVVFLTLVGEALSVYLSLATTVPL